MAAPISTAANLIFIPTPYSPAILLLFRLLLRVFGFLHAGAAQNVAHRVITLVAGVFVDVLAGQRPREFARPRLRPRLRIVDREPIEQRLRTGAREPFDD